MSGWYPAVAITATSQGADDRATSSQLDARQVLGHDLRLPECPRVYTIAGPSTWIPASAKGRMPGDTSKPDVDRMSST